MDPLLQAVSLSASRLTTTDMAVYLLNCLYLMQTTLSLYEFMEDRLERLQVEILHYRNFNYNVVFIKIVVDIKR